MAGQPSVVRRHPVPPPLQRASRQSGPLSLCSGAFFATVPVFLLAFFTATYTSAQTPLTPIMGVEPSTLDFGLVSIGEDGESSIIVRNLADDPRSVLDVTSVEASGDGYAMTYVPAMPIRIRGGGAGVSMAIRFRPRSVGAIHGSIRLVGQAVNSPVTVHLSGEGEVVDIPTMLTAAWDFSTESVSFASKDSFEVAEISGLTTVLTDRTRAGLPCLPVLTAQLLLPRDRKIRDVTYHTVAEPLGPEQHRLYPVQIEGTLDGGPQPPFVPPDPAAYSSPVPYRQRLVEVVHETWLRGYRIATVNVYPLQFVGTTSTVILNTRIAATFTLERMTDEELGQMAPKLRPDSRPSFSEGIRRRMTRRMLNPDALARFYGEVPLPRAGQAYGGFTPSEMPSLDSPPVEYVIVTSSELEESFQPLAGWKTRSGVPAVIRTVEWISQRYAGLDSQERIRNFIRDAFSKWGTNYVLLGGDTEIVPDRFFYVLPSEQLGSMQDPPVDFYYAALDGNWNADGDSHFGEAAQDGQDVLHEVMVARAPVNTSQEAATFVLKVLTYARAPGSLDVDGEYYNSLLLLAGATNSFSVSTSLNGIWSAETIEDAVEAEATEHAAGPPSVMRLYENVFLDPTSCLGDSGYTCHAPGLNIISCQPVGGGSHQITFGVCSGSDAGINRLELTVTNGIEFSAAQGGTSQWVLCTQTPTQLVYRRFGGNPPGMPSNTCEYELNQNGVPQLRFTLSLDPSDPPCLIEAPGIREQLYSAVSPSCTPGSGVLIHDGYVSSLHGCNPFELLPLRTMLCGQNDANDIYAQSRDNNFNEAGVMAELERGYGYVFHQEHSYVDRLGGPSNNAGKGPCCVAEHHPEAPVATTRGVVSNIDSDHQYGIFFSNGSYQNAIDKDSVSEVLMRAPSGGAVAYFGMQRSIHNELRYLVAKAFFVNCFDSANFNDLGSAAYEAMQTGAGVPSRPTTVELLLLGDPAMPLFSDTPHVLTLGGSGLNPITSLGQRILDLSVTQNGQPVPGALVCVSQDGAVGSVGTLLYKFAEADASGTVHLDVSIESDAPLRVTATARNAKPDTASVPVSRDASAPDIFYAGQDLNPGLDDGQGRAKAGYSGTLELTVENRGGGVAQDVSGILAVRGTVTFDLRIKLVGDEDPVKVPGHVFIGPGLRNPPTIPFTFQQLASAGIEPSGPPTIPPAEWGYFVWRQTNDRKWYITWRGQQGGDVFIGSIQSTGGLTEVDYTESFEAITDTLRCDGQSCQGAEPRAVSFRAETASDDLDGVKFGAADIKNLRVTGDDHQDFGNILPGSNASASFGLRILPDAEDAHEALMELELNQIGHPVRFSFFSLELAAPKLSVVRQLPNHLDPGDTTSIAIRVQNRGTADAENVTVQIANEQGATIVIGSRNLGRIRPGKESEAKNLRIRSSNNNNVRLGVTLENRFTAGNNETVQWVQHGVDITTPHRPSWIAALPGPGGAQITWQKPDVVPPPDSAVAGYNIYRREEGEYYLARVNDSLVVGTTFFFDDFTFDSFGLGLGLLEEWPYWYTVVSVDSSWNESKQPDEVETTLWLAELPGWPKQIDVGTESSVLAKDIDGNGDLEILQAGRALYAWHHDGSEVVNGDGDPETDGVFFNDFDALGDINLESGRRFVNELAALPGHLIVGSSWGGRVYFWNPTGQLISNTPCNPCVLQGGSGFASPVIGDMNQDGKPEIVVSTDTGWVYRWTYDPANHSIGAASSDRLYVGSNNYGGPAMGNVDGDAGIEIVYPTRSATQSVIAVDYSLQTPWPRAWTYALGASRFPSTPTLANLDADPALEVVGSFALPDSPSVATVVAVNGGVAFSHWPVVVGHQIGGGDRIPSPAVVDVVGGTAPEIIVGDGIGADSVRVSVYEVATGQRITTWKLGYLRNYQVDVQGVRSPISIVNVDSDPKPEVIHGTDLHHVIVWDSEGAPQPGWPIVVRESVQGRVTIADLDNLGKLEVVASDLSGLIHVWDYRDQLGVGVFGATDTPIPDKLGMNRPNPFNPRTVIPFDVSHRSAVSLRIYSTAGRLLRDLVSGIRVPGRYEAEWDGRDDQGTTLPSGVYFIELRMDGKRVGSRKLLLLR